MSSLTEMAAISPEDLAEAGQSSCTFDDPDNLFAPDDSSCNGDVEMMSLIGKVC